MPANTTFSHTNYFDELIRIRDALTSIKDSTAAIQADFAVIESDITTIKTLGTTCSLGINTTSDWGYYDRALSMISILDADELADIAAEMNDPTVVPNLNDA